MGRWCRGRRLWCRVGAGLARKISSDAAGAFTISRLVPGRYELRVSAKGFAPSTVSDVMVTGGKTTSAAVKLDISVSTRRGGDGGG